LTFAPAVVTFRPTSRDRRPRILWGGILPYDYGQQQADWLASIGLTATRWTLLLGGAPFHRCPEGSELRSVVTRAPLRPILDTSTTPDPFRIGLRVAVKLSKRAGNIAEDEPPLPAQVGVVRLVSVDRQDQAVAERPKSGQPPGRIIDWTVGPAKIVMRARWQESVCDREIQRDVSRVHIPPVDDAAREHVVSDKDVSDIEI